ncbi:hypothetical protein KP626_09270 [Christensenella sp. MSJ-20]|uniref:hypothetical protein n=1 Tax=Christensenella sp. MSJ-20 TaxID=2841518 RepID=UPI001C768E96|nr:hypothetical protein KP626_09270 [Christensenella sp. MSJ-20]
MEFLLTYWCCSVVNLLWIPWNSRDWKKGWGRAKAGELEFYFLKEDGEEPSSFFFAEWEPKPSAASGGKREAKVLGFAR